MLFSAHSDTAAHVDAMFCSSLVVLLLLLLLVVVVVMLHLILILTVSKSRIFFFFDDKSQMPLHYLRKSCVVNPKFFNSSRSKNNSLTKKFSVIVIRVVCRLVFGSWFSSSSSIRLFILCDVCGGNFVAFSYNILYILT